MELEEMKEGWEKLNQKLKKTQIINRQQIKEMIVKRSKTARKRLYRMSLMPILVVPILMVVFPLVYEEIGIGQQLLLNIVTEGLFIYVFFFQMKLLSYIRRMNILEQKVSTVTYYALMFRQWFKISKLFGIPISIAFLFVYFYEIYANTDILSQKEFWITLAIVIPFSVYVCILQVKTIFNSLKAIEKSVQELKELKIEKGDEAN
jgi:hypothetical protein